MVTFNDFRQSFAEAEEDIKYAELSIGSIESIEDENCDPGAKPRGIVIPSINELRYAAKHISNALVEGISDDDKNSQIDKAIRHCVRARLDALKATIIFLCQHFHRFSQDYRLQNLPQDIRNRQNEIREKFISALREIAKNHYDKTNEECNSLRQKLQELHGFYIEVEKQRDVFNQLLYESRQHSNESRQHDKTSTALWIAGIIISAIVSFIIGKLC